MHVLSPGRIPATDTATAISIPDPDLGIATPKVRQGSYSPVLKVREGGRVANVQALVAIGVNADGHREVLGIQATSSEDGAGWLAFFRDLTARGLTLR